MIIQPITSPSYLFSSSATTNNNVVISVGNSTGSIALGSNAFTGGAVQYLNGWNHSLYDSISVENWGSPQVTLKPVRRRPNLPPVKKRKPKREHLYWYCLDCRASDEEFEPYKADRDWLATKACDCGKVMRLVITTTKGQLFRHEGNPLVVPVPGQDEKPCIREIKVVVKGGNDSTEHEKSKGIAQEAPP